MNRSPGPATCIVISAAFLLVLLILPVSGAPATTTTEATVPPVLQACSHATNPVAAFTCQYPENGTAVPDGPPYTVRCLDSTEVLNNQSIASWRWDFGDGGSSTDQNPRHTYSTPSLYDIQLTVTTVCGSQYTNKSLTSLSVYCSAPQPGFNTNVTEGDAPLAVAVTDTSLRSPQDVARWTYWFDDTHSSSERNPVFTYTRPGTYLINQTVWKDCVQIGSTTYPPAVRQIRVNSPAANGTATVNATVPIALPVTTAAVVNVSAPVQVPTTIPVPETTTPVPATGALSVNTDPAGVQIFIDDIPEGTSPATINDLQTGSHTIRFEKEGYRSMSMPVIVSGGRTTEFSTSLVSSGSSGIALLPVAILTLIVLSVIGAGAYLYLKQRAESLED